MYNIRLQAPKLGRKCEIKHWYAYCADGQAVGSRSRDCQIFYDRARDQIKYYWKT